ncbi:hypothetical protein [Cohnella sp. JJ-181]|uniref:hypothetical protein n=1 Tax=Cohnella rhizoplanae TaxID=2974897 RepID=UPI0022FF5A2F|nr:hypothetical protein [Cohnella sp. JJ-181]CAI6085011.1 hypothetical protein COHCIP112018_04529 [Cohnella sp. JJ-181]
MPNEKELQDLKTEQAGAVDLHVTRETDEPVTIEPPEVSPGPYNKSTLESGKRRE